MKIEDFEILRNNRTTPDDFTMEHPCDFCKSFCSQVIVIPCDQGWKDEYRICKTCLTRMIERLDANMVDNFQKDFENREEIPEKCCLCGGIHPDNLCCEI